MRILKQSTLITVHVFCIIHIFNIFFYSHSLHLLIQHIFLEHLSVGWTKSHRLQYTWGNASEYSILTDILINYNETIVYSTGT